MHSGHSHPHSHSPGEQHPPAAPMFSLLRMSALARAGFALAAAIAIWAAVLSVIG